MLGGLLRGERSRALMASVTMVMLGSSGISAQTGSEEPVCCLSPSPAYGIACSPEISDSCTATDGISIPGFLCCSVPDLSGSCLGSPCYSGPFGTEGVGECEAGAWACSPDGALACEGELGPEAESCDGLDNDCDGVIDNSFDLDQDGYRTCDGDCEDSDPSIHPGASDPCDGLDNDCDGAIDEGAICDDGRDCTIDICSRGQCTYWLPCECHGGGPCCAIGCSGPTDPNCDCAEG